MMHLFLGCLARCRIHTLRFLDGRYILHHGRKRLHHYCQLAIFPGFARSWASSDLKFKFSFSVWSNLTCLTVCSLASTACFDALFLGLDGILFPVARGVARRNVEERRRLLGSSYDVIS